jgi:hypothetical protein
MSLRKLNGTAWLSCSKQAKQLNTWGKMQIELALPLRDCVLKEESIRLPKLNNSLAFTTK